MARDIRDRDSQVSKRGGRQLGRLAGREGIGYAMTMLSASGMRSCNRLVGARPA
jgi:hypothetical protein